MKTLTISTTSPEDIKEDIINEAVKTLSSGGLFIYPTDTTYGIGCDATNQQAVDKLLSYKERKEGQAFPIAVSDIEMAQRYVKINAAAENIYRNFLPGAITVISESKGVIAQGIAAENNSLGVRIPDHDLLTKIIKTFGRPIVSTSPNKSYDKRPYSIRDIMDKTSERQKSLVNLILDAGELAHNNPSTVINTLTDNIETLRIGDARFDLEQKYVSESVEKTVELGMRLGNILKNQIAQTNRPVIIAIQGDLGAGKTHFAGGIAKSLGITEPVKSPTFILCNEYEFGLEKASTFYHIDTYRMENEQELLDIGFVNMISKPNIILIEWANRVIPVLDRFKDGCDFVWLKFEHVDEDTRYIYHNIKGLL